MEAVWREDETSESSGGWDKVLEAFGRDFGREEKRRRALGRSAFFGSMLEVSWRQFEGKMRVLKAAEVGTKCWMRFGGTLEEKTRKDELWDWLSCHWSR